MAELLPKQAGILEQAASLVRKSRAIGLRYLFAARRGKRGPGDRLSFAPSRLCSDRWFGAVAGATCHRWVLRDGAGAECVMAGSSPVARCEDRADTRKRYAITRTPCASGRRHFHWLGARRGVAQCVSGHPAGRFSGAVVGAASGGALRRGDPVIIDRRVRGIGVRQRCATWQRLPHYRLRDRWPRAWRVRHSPLLAEGEVETLYVLDDWRDRGVGRKLMRAAAAWLAEAGCKSCFVWVLRENPSRWFYQRLGGKPTAEAVIQFAGQNVPQTAFVWDPDRAPACCVAAGIIAPGRECISCAIGRLR